MSILRTASARVALVACICLACVGVGAWAGTAHADDDDDFGELEDSPRSRQSGADDAADSDEEPAPAVEAEPKSEAPKVEEGPSIAVQPFAGLGIATRSFRRPAMYGVQALEASAVPAFEVGLTVTTRPAGDFSWVISLVYQSALGLTVKEPTLLALKNEVNARSERVALDIAPRWRFGAIHAALAVGASMRTFWPEVHHLATPGYSLLGPHARLDLRLGGLGPVSLRVAPEAQWIVHLDKLLVDQSGAKSQAIALGGEVALDVDLSQVFVLGVHYRQAHAFISTTRGSSMTDVERYLTLRFAGTF